MTIGDVSRTLPRVPAISPKVRLALDLLGPRLAEAGIPGYAALEGDLQQAQQAGDLAAEAQASIAIASQLMSVAKVAAAWSDRPDRGGMPSQEEPLEPAIDLFARALQIGVDRGNEKLAKFARTQLGDCYVQSRQFAKALALLEQTMSACQLPGDAVLAFTTAQLAGDCCLQMENDAAALSWYQWGLSLARDIDDPFEIHVQYGKVASALRNLKRYDESLAHYSDARDLLERIQGDLELQRRITVHKHLFNVDAIPGLAAYTEQRMSETREAIGRDLLADMPDKIAAIASAVLTGRPVPDLREWLVWRSLHTAVRAASRVLADLLEMPWDDTLDAAVSEQSTLQMVGQLVRRHVGEEVPDPESLVRAARYLVQVDRSRRAAIYVRRAEASAAAPGPFGGGTSGHVLYLRSFTASDHVPRQAIEPWGLIDLEELFACAMDRACLVALGNPDPERFGPGRAVTTDENWRAVLRGLAMEAQMLLVLPVYTQGTSWEIEWAVANKFLHKTCFVMPPSLGTETTWWADNWQDLRKWAVRLGLSVPEYSSAGAVFRLTTGGQCDELDFKDVYDTTDLKMRLLYRLLFRTNISWDFAYGVQQGMEQAGTPASSGSPQASSSRERAEAAGVSDASPEELVLLTTLDTSDRREMSNWFYDAPQIPASPGVLMYFETPFRMMWAEAVDNARDTLNQHAAGVPALFTRAFFHQRVHRLATEPQLEQLLAGDLTIEALVSFRVKQMVSYRFVGLPDAGSGERLVDLILRGASKHGTPELMPRT